MLPGFDGCTSKSFSFPFFMLALLLIYRRVVKVPPPPQINKTGTEDLFSEVTTAGTGRMSRSWPWQFQGLGHGSLKVWQSQGLGHLSLKVLAISV